MKRKLSKKLLSLLLSGILIAADIQISQVYAAEETAVSQKSPENETGIENTEDTSLSETQSTQSEQMTEKEPAETTEDTSTEEDAENAKTDLAQQQPAEETASTENTAETDTAETTEETTAEQESAMEEETLTEEETLSEEVTTEETESIQADAEDDTDVPTPQEVYEKMIALQDEFPEGRYWTDASSGDYTWKGGRGENNDIARIGTGCVHFAYKLSDAAFGDLPARRLYPGGFTFADIKVGDILRVDHNSHSVIVLQVNDESVVIAEGNYNKSIHWGRILTKDEVEAADHVLTRYPKGYIPPDDPTANEIIAEGDFNDPEEFEDYKGTLTWKLTNSGTNVIKLSEQPDLMAGV